MSYDKNIYYNPEKYGLSIVSEIDPHESYEFHTFVVFSNEQGKLFWAFDSGCSCPTPFEDHSFDDLTPIDPRNVVDEVKSAATSCYGYYDMKQEINQLANTVRNFAKTHV